MRRVNPPSALLLLLAALAILYPVTLRADDCNRDYRRAEDCLRTPGFAQGLGTAVATAVTVVVNGNAFPPLVIPPKDGEGSPKDGEGEDGGDGEDDGGDDGNGDDEKKKRNYTLDIRTEDQRTSISTDGIDSVWVYAQITCDDPDVDTASLTDSIEFSVEGQYADWIMYDDPTSVEGYQAIEVWAFPPSDDAVLGESGNTVTIDISATVEDAPVGGSVDLMLTEDPFELDVEFIDEVPGDESDAGGDDAN